MWLHLSSKGVREWDQDRLPDIERIRSQQQTCAGRDACSFAKQPSQDLDILNSLIEYDYDMVELCLLMWRTLQLFEVVTARIQVLAVHPAGPKVVAICAYMMTYHLPTSSLHLTSIAPHCRIRKDGVPSYYQLLLSISILKTIAVTAGITSHLSLYTLCPFLAPRFLTCLNDNALFLAAST